MTYLSEFRDYLVSRTDAPEVFHMHAGLCSLAVAMGVSCWVDGSSREIFPNLNVVLLAPSGMGKALAVDTPVPTPSGWSTMGALKVGDEVFSQDGSPTRVKWRSPVWQNRPAFRVETADGDVVVADAEHLWAAELAQDRRPGIYTTARIAAANPRQRPRVRLPGPLDLAESQLPIPPYTLGAWLGDGVARRGQITGKGADLNYIRGRVQAEGFTTTLFRDGLGFGVTGLVTVLKRMGCFRAKHIPSEYLRASVAQRLALLQGLVDTDGYVEPNGHVEFCTTNVDLATGVQELVSSLGGKSSCYVGRAMLNGKDCGPKYRVSFWLANAASLPRKAQHCRDGARAPHRYVRAVPCEPTDTVCIQVEHDSGMFLAGRSMLPTHNSVPLDMAATLVRKAGLGERLLPASFSHEALLEQLSKEPVGLFVIQEFSAFQALLGRDYNAGTEATLTELFDVPDVFQRKLLKDNASFKLKHPCVTIMGATSPDWFARAFKTDTLRGGWLARFLFCPSREAGEPIGDPGPRDEGREAVLAAHLMAVRELHGRFDTRASRRLYDEFTRKCRLAARESADFGGMRSRMPVMASKVAMLFHVSRDPTTTVLKAEDMEAAVTFVERTQAAAEYYLTNEVAYDPKDAQRMRLLDIVHAKGGTVAWSTALKNSHMDKLDFDRAVATLVESGALSVGREGRFRTLHHFAANCRETSPHPVNGVNGSISAAPATSAENYEIVRNGAKSRET